MDKVNGEFRDAMLRLALPKREKLKLGQIEAKRRFV
jgi:hypothetical protein